MTTGPGAAAPPEEPRLRPQLGFFGAVSTGLAAILGAGIFAVIAPATGLAGPAILLALLLAAFIAFCNALSSAQLAAAIPRAGGTYEFGRRMMGPWWGFGAGWMFLVANTVGPGAIALAFGEYVSAVWGGVPTRLIAVGAALAMTALNVAGIRRSVRVTEAFVLLSIVTLVAVVAVGLVHGDPSNLTPFAGGIRGTLEATALIFFAYTGYSRIATLVEEVRDPQRTIPRATVVALGTATVIYLLVALTAVTVLGAPRLAGATSPLETTMVVVGSVAGAGLVAIGALATTFNEGLSDLLGVSRVAFAMGRAHDLPAPLARLGPGANPWAAVLAVGVVSVLVASFAPFTLAIALSSFGTLLYYTVTNLSALRLAPEHRRFPRGLAVAGLVGCGGLALSLAPLQVGIGLLILAIGLGARAVLTLSGRAAAPS